jgi:hypothetical protein
MLWDQFWDYCDAKADYKPTKEELEAARDGRALWEAAYVREAPQNGAPADTVFALRAPGWTKSVVVDFVGSERDYFLTARI